MSRKPVPTAALALGIALSAVLLSSPVAAHAHSSGPQLSISIDDSEASAEVGDTLTYVITVDNLGSARVKNLQVSQSVPDGVELLSANHQGVAKASGVEWSVDLAPGGQATLRTSLKVGRTSVELLRLATVACAAVSPSKSPEVCATDSDELAAGAAARVSAAPDDENSEGGSGGAGLTSTQLGSLAAVALLLVGGIGWFGLWSRIRVQPR